MTKMPIGFDKPLYVLPFDHRVTFKKNMFGWSGTLTAEQTAQISAFKQVIYEALQAAVAAGVPPREKAGVLVDEQFALPFCAMPRKKATSPPSPPRRAVKLSSTLNTEKTSLNTSKL